MSWPEALTLGVTVGVIVGVLMSMASTAGDRRRLIAGHEKELRRVKAAQTGVMQESSQVLADLRFQADKLSSVAKDLGRRYLGAYNEAEGAQTALGQADQAYEDLLSRHRQIPLAFRKTEVDFDLDEVEPPLAAIEAAAATPVPEWDQESGAWPQAGDPKHIDPNLIVHIDPDGTAHVGYGQESEFAEQVIEQLRDETEKRYIEAVIGDGGTPLGFVATGLAVRSPVTKAYPAKRQISKNARRKKRGR